MGRAISSAHPMNKRFETYLKSFSFFLLSSFLVYAPFSHAESAGNCSYFAKVSKMSLLQPLDTGLGGSRSEVWVYAGRLDHAQVYHRMGAKQITSVEVDHESDLNRELTLENSGYFEITGANEYEKSGLYIVVEEEDGLGTSEDMVIEPYAIIANDLPYTGCNKPEFGSHYKVDCANRLVYNKSIKLWVNIIRTCRVAG